MELKTIDIDQHETKLLGAALVFLIIFAVGFIIDSARLMMLSMFFCIVVQGMRRK